MKPVFFILGSWVAALVAVFGPEKAQGIRARFSQWVNCMYVWLFVQADKRAKCPACGHRQEHPIAWNAELRRLIHQCAFCKALFSEPPVVQAQEWEVISPFMEPPETEEKFQPYSGASREPVLHPAYRQSK